MKKVGHLYPNPSEDENQPDYIGKIMTKVGERRITAYLGRNRKGESYLNLYYGGRKVRVSTERWSKEVDYTGNVEGEKIIPIIVRPVLNENKNIIVSFDVYYDSPRN